MCSGLHNRRAHTLVGWMGVLAWLVCMMSCIPTMPPYPVLTGSPPLKLPLPLPPTDEMFAFRDGLRRVAKDLVRQLDIGVRTKNQERQGGATTPVVVMQKTVVDPFLLVATGEALKINDIIADVMDPATRPHLQIQPMTPQTFSTAAYVLNGVIALDTHPRTHRQQYHLAVSLFEKTTGLIVGHSEVWVTNLAEGEHPLQIYKDSPVYIKDRGLENLVSSVNREPGDTVEPKYASTLQVRSSLAEGDTFYEQRKVEEALARYEAAERRPEGQTMKVYAGLYSLYRLRHDRPRAEMAFKRLVEVSVAETNAITVKLLFEVNTTTFVNDPPGIGQEFAMWVRQISAAVERTPRVCLRIVGHTSRTGTAEYNNKLSTDRAKSVQDLMGKTSPGIAKRSEAIGMGFAENIVGTGTDDALDAFDRRVEFLLTSCPT